MSINCTSKGGLMNRRNSKKSSMFKPQKKEPGEGILFNKGTFAPPLNKMKSFDHKAKRRMNASINKKDL